jgi:hypothetical protein
MSGWPVVQHDEDMDERAVRSADVPSTAIKDRRSAITAGLPEGTPTF